MTTEDYVSYPIALALKKAGFDWQCDHYYNGHGNLNRYADTDRINRNTNGHHTPSCSAPTLWHAQKWLREKKGVLLWAYPDRQLTDEEYSEIELTGEWWWDTEGAIRECSGDTYPSYEQALSAGIAAALELIEKKGE